MSIHKKNKSCSNCDAPMKYISTNGYWFCCSCKNSESEYSDHVFNFLCHNPSMEPDTCTGGFQDCQSEDF